MSPFQDPKLPYLFPSLNPILNLLPSIISAQKPSPSRNPHPSSFVPQRQRFFSSVWTPGSSINPHPGSFVPQRHWSSTFSSSSTRWSSSDAGLPYS
ncbi:hypothetical protein MRB53_028378 [Persea americana]|uniref:Uncharacterized protein n=1 Tax=Persea americana TaxID=3435 RepID=A0ACC2KFE8_PERAE|nr:hypothetical protein MRB53_028378 [Persea americana]